jgi:8-oxo-dGTP pyrophosphatase MutT (NUDIX family)
LNRVGQVQVVVLRQIATVWQVLMLKRGPADGGFWQPVTGGINPGEDPAKAALRELGEETGITTGRLVDPDYTFKFTVAGGTLTERVFGVVVGAEADPILSREHVEYRWVDLGDAIRLLRYASNKDSVRHMHDLVAAAGRSRRTSGRP